MTNEALLQTDTSDGHVLKLVREAMLDVMAEPRARQRVERATMDTPLDSLGADSIMTLEIVSCIEDRTGLLLVDDQLMRQRSVGDVVRYLQDLLRRGGSGQ